MLVEDHTEQIVGLAFMPVGSAPDTGNAWHMWVFLVQKYLEPDAMKPGRGKQMIVDLKARFFFWPAIESANVRQKIKLLVRSALKKSANGHNVFARDHDGRFLKRLNHVA